MDYRLVVVAFFNQHTSLKFCFRVLFFFNDPATTDIYTLSLHDALPISPRAVRRQDRKPMREPQRQCRAIGQREDRKSTRLNSSHVRISYAVFCLKKKNYAPCLTITWHVVHAQLPHHACSSPKSKCFDTF